MNLTGSGAAEFVIGNRATPSFFAVMGVPALIGRTVDAKDDKSGDDVVVISHSLWMRRFNGDPKAVGRTLRFDDKRYVMVGVMPEGSGSRLRMDAIAKRLQQDHPETNWKIGAVMVSLIDEVVHDTRMDELMEKDCVRLVWIRLRRYGTSSASYFSISFLISAGGSNRSGGMSTFDFTSRVVRESWLPMKFCTSFPGTRSPSKGL